MVIKNQDIKNEALVGASFIYKQIDYYFFKAFFTAFAIALSAEAFAASSFF